MATVGSFLLQLRAVTSKPQALKNGTGRRLKPARLIPFELYVFRHTCLTRWAKWMDPFTLHRVAGHTDMKTTLRYVHPSDEDIDEAIEKARNASSGHTTGIPQKNDARGAKWKSTCSQLKLRE